MFFSYFSVSFNLHHLQNQTKEKGIENKKNEKGGFLIYLPFIFLASLQETFERFFLKANPKGTFSIFGMCPFLFTLNKMP